MGGGCCCCNAAAGAAATLQLNCAPMAPHYAPLAARRAARCCSASVGESASRLATHASSRCLPSEALARLLTNDDSCYNGLLLYLWKATRGGSGHVVTHKRLVAMGIHSSNDRGWLQWCKWPACSSLHCLHCFCSEGAEPRLAEANLGIVILQGSSHLP